MSQKLNAPRGTVDVLPPESALYQFITDTARKNFTKFGFSEIQVPVFEHTELFVRGVGETTDVVTKEMYTFQDRKGRSLTLRPEGTAGVMRAYLEHNMGTLDPVQKLYYIGPMFRYERPQAGRLRQHTQVGCECIGSPRPEVDAEIISLYCSFIKDLGLSNIRILLNTLGDETCRPQYKAALQEYLKANLENLCPDCQSRFEKNPLRILDCKVEKCKEIAGGSPVMLDFLSPSCTEHFDTVKALLGDLGIDYDVNPKLVRGLDYYTHTVFEVQVTGLGAQNAIGGGGRYNNLIEELGGPSVPSIGFGSGVERLALTLKSHQVALPDFNRKSTFIVALGDPAVRKAVTIANQLRTTGKSVELDYRFGSFKAQLKYADKLGCPQVLILGEDELNKGIAICKNMTSGEQEEIPLTEIMNRL